MESSSDIKTDIVIRQGEVRGPQVSETKSKPSFYDIDDPPAADEQFAMFPDRPKDKQNLAYVLMKMEGSTERLPLVFCTDCAGPKAIIYCNGDYEYLYEPCPVDRDFYCPKFYAELMRRFWPDMVSRNGSPLTLILPSLSETKQHAQGCIYSSSPDFIIQRQGGVYDSIYFRRCGDEFRNAAMQQINLENLEDATTPDTSRSAQQGRYIGLHMVPGLEWKEATRMQSVMFVGGMIHL